MSFVGANDHSDPVSPQDPLYYAPRSARGMADPRSHATPQTGSGDLHPIASSRFDEMREEAYAKFARPLESQFEKRSLRTRRFHFDACIGYTDASGAIRRFPGAARRVQAVSKGTRRRRPGRFRTFRCDGQGSVRQGYA